MADCNIEAGIHVSGCTHTVESAPQPKSTEQVVAEQKIADLVAKAEPAGTPASGLVDSLTPRQAIDLYLDGLSEDWHQATFGPDEEGLLDHIERLVEVAKIEAAAEIERLTEEAQADDWFRERINAIFSPLAAEWREATGKTMTSLGYESLIEWERERLIETLAAALEEHERAEQAEAALAQARAERDTAVDAAHFNSTETNRLRAALVEFGQHKPVDGFGCPGIDSPDRCTCGFTKKVEA